jgi:hypothetical protein
MKILPGPINKILSIIRFYEKSINIQIKCPKNWIKYQMILNWENNENSKKNILFIKKNH